MSKTVFRIENGKFALSPVGGADDPDWVAPGGSNVDDADLAMYTANGGDFSCQVQSGAVTSSPNSTTETIDATFCDPEETKTIVGLTSFVLDVTALQDPQIVEGVSRYLFEHDTEKAYAFLGFDGTNPPKAVGKVTVQ